MSRRSATLNRSTVSAENADSTEVAMLPENVAHELQGYLPAALWHKLMQPQPERRDLLTVLDQLRSHLYLLSTYLPRHVVNRHGAFSEKVAQPEDGAAILNGAEGTEMAGSLLFSDVSGFTQLSEALSQQGPDGIEQLTAILNTYFSRMLDILASSNGILLKFAGDALWVHFPEQPAQEQAAWALRAAWRMMDAMQDFAEIAIKSSSGATGQSAPTDTVTLRMKIGLATGQFHAVTVGSDLRREYIVLGETVSRTMAGESCATAGQVLVDEATRQAFPEAVYTDPAHAEPAHAAPAPGFHIATPTPGAAIGDFEIRVATYRRGRGSAAWMVDKSEILLDILRIHTQIRALSAYLSEELVQWLRQEARHPDRASTTTARSENRPTVIAFINVTGFEPLLQAAATPKDLALVYSMIDDYFRAVHESVTHFGGIISRIDPYKQGSKLLLLFGAPRAHEDDVLRAVRATLRLRDTLLTLNRRWEQRRRRAQALRDGESEIHQHTGITYGITFAGEVGSPTRREYTVMGDDVNLAARLMGAAEPDRILVSDAIWRILTKRRSETHVVLTPLPPMQVKGKAHPLAVYQLEGFAAPASQEPADSPIEIIGRETELAQADALVAAAMKGSGNQIMLRGTAGVGKSLFVRAFGERLAATGARIVVTRCPAFDVGAYAVWIALMQQLAAMDPIAGASVQAAQLQRFLNGLPGLEPIHVATLFRLLGLPHAVPRSAAPDTSSALTPASSAQSPRSSGLFARLEQRAPATDATQVEQGGTAARSLWEVAGARKTSDEMPPSTTWRMLTTRIANRQQTHLLLAVTAMLTRLAQQHPLMLVFEDCQWMDRASMKLLQAVAADPAPRAYALLAVRRTEAGQEGELPEGASSDRSLTMSPLPGDETAMMVARLLGDSVPPDELLTVSQMIHEKSQGNPLMVEELAVWWREHHDSGGLAMGLHASVTLSELVMSRVDRLNAELSNVVRIATIPDGDFTHTDLILLYDPAAGDVVAGKIEGVLQVLAERQFLIRSGTSSPPRYCFRQTLVREILYDSLPTARRRIYHARFAAYLERNPEAVQPRRLAYHHQQAQNWSTAAHYLVLSGDAAARHGTLAQAKSAFEAALEALSRMESTEITQHLRTRALEGVGDVDFHDGAFNQSARTYGEAAATLSHDKAGPRLVAKQILALFAGNDPEPAGKKAKTLSTSGRGCEFVAVTVLAWLHDSEEAESKNRDANPWRRKAEDAVAQAFAADPVRARAVVAELQSDWETASEIYDVLEEPTGAALARYRQGEARLRAGDIPMAAMAYQDAITQWQNAGDASSVALAACRWAEALHQLGRSTEAAAALGHAMRWLDTPHLADPADRAMMDSALAALSAQQPIRCATTSWQTHVNKWRAGQLFSLLEELEP